MGPSKMLTCSLLLDLSEPENAMMLVTLAFSALNRSFLQSSNSVRKKMETNQIPVAFANISN